jgi:hypothetical protein
MVAGALTVAVLVAAAWFPAAALYHQHQQLSATSAQLARLRAQDAALGQEEQRLKSPAEVARIARQQYELVAPGQQVYEVVPPSGAATASYAGDPGLQPPVSPSGASPAPGSTTASSSATPARARRATRATSATSGVGPPSSLVGRIVQTLEFWR